MVHFMKAFVFGLFLSIIIVPALSQSDVFLDETKTLANGMVWAEGYDLVADREYSIQLEVITGNAIDLLVMDSINYASYKAGVQTGKIVSFDYYIAYSALHTKSKDYSIIPEKSEKLYFCVENAQYTPGGAPGGQSVDVHLRIATMEETAKEDSIPFPGFTFYSLIFSLVLLFIWRFHR